MLGIIKSKQLLVSVVDIFIVDNKFYYILFNSQHVLRSILVLYDMSFRNYITWKICWIIQNEMNISFKLLLCHVLNF